MKKPYLSRFFDRLKKQELNFENLLCKGEEIPSDFVERMKKDSQYIAKEAVKMVNVW